ncbi:hypothetical protein BJ508DRAFT_325984 [Ascobolus immersus RN42]|uniref:Nuclear protein Qri2/Nse4 n=1 Tax=Ascobolus immersus RN42 TaxID=1160509 RepID=A0A3N4I930_ASCIM|nr:hypothetical protein BJ508DRAFT_325984 [Ascobolus immersus RN42]
MGPMVHSNPEAVMVIRDLVPSFLTTFSLPFSRGGVVKFGGRATAVKLSNGKIAVFSPVSLTNDVKKTISSMGGDVGYLIAPDIEHHIHLNAWHDAYPNSQILAPEGLPEKRKKQSHPPLPFPYVVTASNKSTILPPDLAREFKLEYSPMHPNKELAFLHIPTKSLIVADLLFNLPAKEQYSKAPESHGGVLTSLVQKFLGLEGEAKGQLRWNWWLAAAKDRKGFAEGVKEIRAWDFDRIIPCHGDVIEGRQNSTGAWDKVFKWFLDDSVKK